MMKITIAGYRRLMPLVIFVLTCMGINSVQASPILWSGNNHLYEVISSAEITFEAAESAAIGLGAGWNLASITSAAEQAFITSLLPTAPADRTHYWLGGTDRVTEGDWQWLDGEVWIDGTSYENWWGGEPNNVSGEDFLTMDYRTSGPGWAWNDISNGNASLIAGYIVEKSVPEPTTLVLLGLGLLGLGFNKGKRL